MERVVLVAVLFLASSSVVIAQENEAETDNIEEKTSEYRHKTYFKVGFDYTVVNIKGFNIRTDGLDMGLETHFIKRHLGLSGWFAGYRKDNLRTSIDGHVLNAGLFSTIRFVKIGAGAEWGLVSTNFSRTRFQYDDNGALVSYEHLFPYRNTNIPGYAATRDSALYPFVEASVFKRWDRFIVEAGVRGNIQGFGFDRYYLDGDKITFISSTRKRIVPLLLLRAGIAIG